jgi:hypothetical protein
LAAPQCLVGCHAGIVEDQRNINVTGVQQTRGVRGLGLHEPQLDARVGSGEGGRGYRHEGAERGGERGQPHPTGEQASVLGQLGLGGVEAAKDLLRAIGKQPAGGGQSNPTSGALHQPSAGLRFEAGEVVTDRRLGIAQLASGRGDRPAAGDRGQHSEPGDVEHAQQHINQADGLNRGLALDQWILRGHHRVHGPNPAP